MPAIRAESELALQQARAPRRVDHPAGLGCRLATVLLERDTVRLTSAAQLDVPYACALCHVDAEPPCAAGQLGLEQAPVELEVVLRRPTSRAHLEPLGDVAVAVRG